MLLDTERLHVHYVFNIHAMVFPFFAICFVYFIVLCM